MNAISKKAILLSLGLLLFFIVSSIVSKPSLALENTTYPRKIRVIEVRFFPAGDNYIYHPDTLSAQLQTNLKENSKFHGYSNPSSIASSEIEVVQVINHQFKRPSGGGDWQESYKQILQQDNLCQLIKDQNIDQLWVWADPRTGFDESPGMEYVISSNSFRNSVQPVTLPSTPFCNGERGFTFFEFDFSRTVDNAVHSYGHYLEGLIGNLQSGELFWNQYSGLNSTLRSERCGNVHFPPNGRNDYDYSNASYVRSSCESWNPAVNGTKIRMNCTRWGCTQGGYLKWWMQNMPNQGNTLMYQGKKLPNWFDFITDIDSTISTYKNNNTYYLNQAFLDINQPPVPAPVQIGTTSTIKQNSGTQLSLSHIVAGNSPILIVSASYRAATNPSAQIQSLTYGSQNLESVRRDAHNDRVSEIWYLANPQIGEATLSATWSANPEDQVLIATTVNDVKIENPIALSAGAGSDIQDGNNSATPSVTIGSAANEIVLGVLSTYPDGGSNTASAVNGTAEVWNVRTGNNNIASQGAGKPGAASVDLEFNTPKNWSWAMSAVSIRINVSPLVNMNLSTNKSAYINGQDSSAILTAVVADENGNSISGLSTSSFVSTLDLTTSDIVFSETATLGTYAGTLDLSTLENGSHTVQTQVTDSRSLTQTKSVSFSISDPQQQATTSRVDSITYSTAGGKSNNKNLLITVNIKDNIGGLVSGASVGINLKRTGSSVYTSSATTNSLGNVVFTYLNAASACYITEVVSVVANGLTWDGLTPANQFCK